MCAAYRGADLFAEVGFEVREMSRANIKINTECEPGTQGRKVIVSGAPDAVQYALSMIAQKLAQGP